MLCVADSWGRCESQKPGGSDQRNLISPGSRYQKVGFRVSRVILGSREAFFLASYGLWWFLTCLGIPCVVSFHGHLTQMTVTGSKADLNPV